MKKWLSLILLGAVSLSLLGCNGGSKEQYQHLSDEDATTKTKQMMSTVDNINEESDKKNPFSTGISGLFVDLIVNNGSWQYDERSGWHTKESALVAKVTCKLRVSDKHLETSCVVETSLIKKTKVSITCNLNQTANGLYEGSYTETIAENDKEIVKIVCSLLNFDPETGAGNYQVKVTVNGKTEDVNFTKQ